MARRRHTEEFRREAVQLMREQGYSNADADAERSPGFHGNLLRSWRRKYADRHSVDLMSDTAQQELRRLRKEVRRLRTEREILKKRQPSSRMKRTEMSVHRETQRRMADHTDAPGVAGQSQRLLRMEKTFGEQTLDSSGGCGIKDKADSCGTSQGYLRESTDSSGTGVPRM